MTGKKVTGRLVTEAYINFRKVTNSPKNENTRRVFNQFINVPEGFNSFWSGLGNPSEETITKLNWLTGPHYEFMFKVWKAKYGSITGSKAGAESVEVVGERDREG